MYPSATYQAVRTRRLRSIERRATSQLREAFAAGELSMNRAEILSKLSPTRQRQILAHEQFEKNAQRVAAAVLHDLLSRGQRIDLSAIADAIRSSVSRHR
jgi:hypothetical protein